MPTISMEGSRYEGRTSSPPWRRPYDPLECRACGSSLIGRREAVRRDISRGIRFVTEIFRCRCGRGPHIKQEVAATS